LSATDPFSHKKVAKDFASYTQNLFKKDNTTTNCRVKRHLISTTNHKHGLHAELNLEQRFLRSREKSGLQPN
jgi:hypothetical protein